MFFAFRSHAHLFGLVCLACMVVGASQVQRGWRSIDQVRGHLADIHERPEGRLAGRYPAEIAPLREDLDEILGNILENACKWARSSCRVDARVEAGRVIVVIDDDGPGIPAEVRDRLPARGIRADEVAPGSGLGLSIAQDCPRTSSHPSP
jgi:signal transduction histidine kinase